VTFNTAVQRGVSVNTHDPVGGTLIGRITADGSVPNGQVIAEWAQGAAVGNGQVLAGPRMSFLTGSREVDGVSGETAGIFDLSTVGQQLFLNTVAYMGGQGFLPGDVDNMNGVDLVDYQIIRDHFLQNATMRSEGDLNNDGFVDFRDFRLWKNNFPTPPPGSGAIVEAVPEPSGVCLLCLLLLTLSSGFARRGR
jgi:hypothetical protein